MIWGYFNYNEKSSLTFISGRQDYHEYQDNPKKPLLLFKFKSGVENPIFSRIEPDVTQLVQQRSDSKIKILRL